MEIGIKLKEARIKFGLTQENVAEEIQVSRQTISNWENEKSYPDIISVIKLKEMIGHLEESTNVVKSNGKLMLAIAANIVIMFIIIFFNSIISRNNYMIVCILSFAVISSTALFYQIIRNF